MLMKPDACVNKNCPGGENCSMCINRSAIAKKGHELIQAIELCPPSVAQTNAVSMAGDYVEFCSKFIR
jgi:hypothetical protein